MGPIRRTINLTLALSLTGAGLYILSLLLHADRFLGRIAMAGGMMVSLGVYWLWSDFINADPRPEK
jgi:hypothetical protein